MSFVAVLLRLVGAAYYSRHYPVPPAAPGAPPAFRSALEQVAFETNVAASAYVGGAVAPAPKRVRGFGALFGW